MNFPSLPSDPELSEKSSNKSIEILKFNDSAEIIPEKIKE
jgi:hypothetical protein